MITKTLPHKLRSPHLQHKYDRMVQKILDTSRAIMREQGVAALSMQEIARRIDLRAPSLYNYFGSKMEIYDALFQSGFTLFGEGWNLASKDAQSLTEYLSRYFDYYLGFARQNPDLFQLCFERPVPGFVPSSTSLQVSFSQLEQAHRRVLEFEELQRTGLKPEQFVDLVIALIHGITAMHMANEPELPVDQGRFGTLPPIALDLLEKIWQPKT